MEVYKAAIVNLCVKGLGIFLSIAVSWFLARVLSIEEFGQYSYVIATLLAVAVPLGTGSADFLVREIGGSASVDRTLDVASFLLFIILLTCCSYLIFLSLIFYSDFLEKWRILFLTCLGVALYSVLYLMSGYLRVCGRVTLGVVPEQVIRQGAFLGIILCMYFFAIKVDFYRALLVQVVSLFAAGLFSLALIYRHGRLLKPMRFRFSKAVFGSYKIWIGSLAALVFLSGIQTIISQGPLLLLGNLGLHSDVANYRVADLISGLNALPLLIALSLVGPLAARAKHTNNIAELNVVLQKLFYLTLAICLPSSALVFLFGDSLLAYLFGIHYLGATPILKVLTFGTFVSAVSGPVGLILVMFSHERFVIITSLFMLVFQLVISILIVDSFGANGVATVASGCKAILALVTSVYLYKIEGLSFLQLSDVSGRFR